MCIPLCNVVSTRREGQNAQIPGTGRASTPRSVQAAASHQWFSGQLWHSRTWLIDFH